MKKLLKAILVICFMLSFTIMPYSPTFAQIRYPMIPTYVVADTSAVVAAGKEIYGYTIFATGGANATCALYDVANIGDSGPTNVKSEAGEATQWNSQTIWFLKPLVTANGCSIAVNNATVIIYHQP